MRRWVRALLAACLTLFYASGASALSTGVPITPLFPVIPPPKFELPAPIPVAFDPVPSRLTDVPYDQWDLNRDGQLDIGIQADMVNGLNGTTIQLLDPPAASLDQVQSVPATGYTAAESTRLSAVYVAKLPGGDYAKFMLLQVSPKRTVWWAPGKVTTSELRADGTGGHALLTWDGLPDAALGYDILRYQITGESFTATALNDLPVAELTFTDTKAKNTTYIYQVVAIRADGTAGSRTTAAPVRVQALRHTLTIPLTGPVTLDGTPIATEATARIREGWMMAPATLLELAGASVSYDASARTVTMSRKYGVGMYTVVMPIGSEEYTFNGTTYSADVPAYLDGSTVMVPLRIVPSALSFTFSFNKIERAAVIVWYE